MGLSLDAQREKLNRILDDRVKLYRHCVSKGSLDSETGAVKHAEVEAIRTIFGWFCDNADWIREEARRRADRARQLAEIDEALRADPAAAAVVSAFPGACVTIAERGDPE